MEHDSALGAILAAGASHCAVVVADHGGIFLSLLLTGLVGSLSHCSGMCGPFVLSQVSCRLETIPARQMREWHRVSGALLLPYHLGRLTTYSLLGVLAALAAGSLGALSLLRWLSPALLGLAALLMAGMAVPALKGFLPSLSGSRLAGGMLSGWLERARPLFARPLGWRGYMLGVMLGFIPCGLLYGAVAAAAATGDPLAGGLGMMAFTAGTVPNLVLVAVIGQWAAGRWRELMRKAAPWLLLFNAAVLAGLAIEGLWRQG